MHVIAATVASDPVKYNEAFLGKPNQEYCGWILDPEKWGAPESREPKLAMASILGEEAAAAATKPPPAAVGTTTVRAQPTDQGEASKITISTIGSEEPDAEKVGLGLKVDERSQVYSKGPEFPICGSLIKKGRVDWKFRRRKQEAGEGVETTVEGSKSNPVWEQQKRTTGIAAETCRSEKDVAASEEKRKVRVNRERRWKRSPSMESSSGSRGLSPKLQILTGKQRVRAADVAPPIDKDRKSARMSSGAAPPSPATHLGARPWPAEETTENELSRRGRGVLGKMSNVASGSTPRRSTNFSPPESEVKRELAEKDSTSALLVSSISRERSRRTEPDARQQPRRRIDCAPSEKKSPTVGMRKMEGGGRVSSLANPRAAVRERLGQAVRVFYADGPSGAGSCALEGEQRHGLAAIKEDWTVGPKYLGHRAQLNKSIITFSNILSSFSREGAIELAILADYYGREIAAYDIQTTRCDLYGQDKKYSERVMLIYDGLHYDALAMSPVAEAPEEFDQTIFLVHRDRTVGPVEGLALNLVKDQQRKRSYTDTANFTLRCGVCQIGVIGQKEAVEHAQATGHVNFQEY
ncbi:unnamed protein product [Linum tenue]|uniref:Ubiquitin thioesterase OTU n=2 Tax=Linum tenue TaxID=586396 RepID=A0AAV0H5D4_9ROSI|nr:unnamed protein product [Linum tenue]